MIEYRDAFENQGDVAMNYVVSPRSTDYALGLRSYNEDVFAFGAGFDVELTKGWQLSLLYRHEQADEVDSNAFAPFPLDVQPAGAAAARRYCLCVEAPWPGRSQDRPG